MDLKNTNKNILRVLLILGVVFPVAFCSGSAKEMEKVGAPRDIAQNGGEVDSIGRFAVQQHNKKQNGALEFVRVVKAKEQVVAGMMYHLILEAVDGGKKKMFEAKVWVKPWMSFKELHEFKEANDNNPSFTSSDLGVMHGR